MLDKLHIVKQRFDEVADLIIQPDIITDQKRYVRLTKEYKDLNDMVVKIKEYEVLLNNVAEAKNGNLIFFDSVKIWEYDIYSDGSVANKKEFMTFDDFGMDGMRCDAVGNLYITRYDKGTVLIASSDKKILKEVQLKGKKPSNITFGGADGKTCYVTMADRGCFESFQALNSGAFYDRIH